MSTTDDQEMERPNVVRQTRTSRKPLPRTLPRVITARDVVPVPLSKVLPGAVIVQGGVVLDTQHVGGVVRLLTSGGVTIVDKPDATIQVLCRLALPLVEIIRAHS